MATELVSKADRAFVDEDYEQAVALYTQAVEQLTGAERATVYASRANAHLKLDNLMEAVEDANKALELDACNAKAYLRKGIACFKLEEYEAARDALEAGSKLAPTESQFKTWLRKCEAELQDEKGAGSHAGAPAVNSSATQPAAQPVANSSTATPEQTPALAPSAPAAFEGKYRHQHYQMQNKVTVDVFAKNLAKEQVSVQFDAQRLTVVINDTAGNEEYKLDVELYGEIKPQECRYEVLRTKVEVVMVKANTLQWGSLEKSNKVAAPNYSNTATAPVGGQYPSSAPKRKDWSALEAEVKEMEKKGELADDPLNDFFKNIYAQGDEDSRRAMMKSFIESNGTVLSTNWKEVGRGKVECAPPSGMEPKKWNA